MEPYLKKKYLKKKSKPLSKRVRHDSRIREIAGKSFLLNKKFFLVYFNLKRFFYKISIRFTQNNIFCTWRNNSKNKNLFFCSAGRYGVKISRKRLRFNNKFIIRSFLVGMRKKIKLKQKKQNRFLIEIICPIRLRKNLVKLIGKTLRKNIFILRFKEKKCFNGCRPKKMRRKKRKRFIVSK